MKRHRIKQGQKIIAYALLTVFWVSGAVSSGSRVLCVGDEGHSNIERIAECCCDSGVHSLFGIDSESKGHEDPKCGECVDIEVSNFLSTKRSFEGSDHHSTPHIFAISYLDSRERTPSFDFVGQQNLPSLSPTVSQLVVTTTILIL